MANTRRPFIKTLTSVIAFALIGFPSCDRSKADPKPLIFETGPVRFFKLGGGIEGFHIIIEDLGSKSIQEYGMVYAFDSKEITVDPVVSDRKVIFEEPPKVGGISKNVQIGYPVGTTCVVCRAYAVFKDGTVQYAKSQKILF